MQRFQDWPTRMDRWIFANAKNEHAYGAWDCALMCAAHIDAITGSALYAEHSMQYLDAAGAEAYLATLGVDGLAGMATLILGEPLRNEKTAQRGDVVIFDTDLGPALGLVDLTGTKIMALSPSTTGFIRLPRSLATGAWRV